MRVTIDWSLCIGSGLCLVAAPGVLALVPYAGAWRAGLAAGATDGALMAAARACPTMAIRLTDDVGQPIYPPSGPPRVR